MQSIETTTEITGAWRNDMEEAHENACEAFHAIEALQRTDTWHALPPSVRRTLCAAHASLGVIADGLAEVF